MGFSSRWENAETCPSLQVCRELSRRYRRDLALHARNSELPQSSTARCSPQKLADRLLSSYKASDRTSLQAVSTEPARQLLRRFHKASVGE